MTFISSYQKGFVNFERGYLWYLREKSYKTYPILTYEDLFPCLYFTQVACLENSARKKVRIN